MENVVTVTVDLASKRTRCHSYTRVMGFIRPVSRFNVGKKSEFYSRKYYQWEEGGSKDMKTTNRDFIARYGE